MTKSELKDIIKECLYESGVINEDKSDIARHYKAEYDRQNYRSQNGESKRPSISDNMNKDDKQRLHDYDHGGRHQNDHQYDSRDSHADKKRYEDTVRTASFGDAQSTRNHFSTSYGKFTGKERHSGQTANLKRTSDDWNNIDNEGKYSTK